MSKQLQQTISQWDTLASGALEKVTEVQKSLTMVREQHARLADEQENIRRMRVGYADQLKTLQSESCDLQRVTHLRRFLGQLDSATDSIVTELAGLQNQQRLIQARFRELNAQHVKFETLAARARKALASKINLKEQKESDLLNVMRFDQRSRQG